MYHANDGSAQYQFNKQYQTQIVCLLNETSDYGVLLLITNEYDGIAAYKRHMSNTLALNSIFLPTVWYDVTDVSGYVTIDGIKLVHVNVEM